MWQKLYEQYGSDDFTVVGLALDAEGIAPAKLYYEKHGVTFPSLVDPDYATQFGAVPKTFFVDEHGVVLDAKNWKQQLAISKGVKSVTDDIRSQWSKPASRFDADALATLVQANARTPRDLAIATQLGSRYIALGLQSEAVLVLSRAVQKYEIKETARKGGPESQMLGQAYFQLMRCYSSDRVRQVRYATASYNLNPSIGFAKQIARLIDPEKFDSTKNGRLDNTFREATYQRLKRERTQWLAD